MSNNRYFIEFSYDGSLYHGFQKQLNAITVQEIMENGISTILRDRIDIVSAGRGLMLYQGLIIIILQVLKTPLIINTDIT